MANEALRHHGQRGSLDLAQVALVIFLGVFVAVVIRTFLPSRSKEMNEHARLPFDEAPEARHHSHRNAER